MKSVNHPTRENPMADVQVSVAATRFVDAVVALRLARRHYHRLDGALVQVPHRERTQHWEDAWNALRGLDHAIAERYGAWQLKSTYGKEYIGIQRSTFLVDPEGRIVRTWPKVTADGHPAEVLAALAESRAGRHG